MESTVSLLMEAMFGVLCAIDANDHYAPMASMQDSLAQWAAKHPLITCSTDSRQIEAEQFFVALKGQRADGHDFIADAVRRGAIGIIHGKGYRSLISDIDATLRCGVLWIEVEDPLCALQSLATIWRRQLTIPVVGITGSIGKTTTKEILRSIMAAAGIQACISRGNENSDIGLPLNLLRINRTDAVAIVEMGINAVGEMDVLVDMALPTHGLITTIAHSHVHGLGSLVEIAEEKKKLFKYFGPENVGIIDGDQRLLATAFYPHPIIRFGNKKGSQVCGSKFRPQISEDGVALIAELRFKSYEHQATVRLRTPHRGTVHNALAAAAVAHLLRVPFSAVCQGIENFSGFEHRFEQRLVHDGRGILISDCYNANPQSTQAAIAAFEQLPSKGKKIAVLGDMLELGARERFWHCQVGRFLGKMRTITLVILVGSRARSMVPVLPVHMSVVCVDDWYAAYDRLQGEIDANSMILLKASRALGFRDLAKKMTE